MTLSEAYAILPGIGDIADAVNAVAEQFDLDFEEFDARHGEELLGKLARLIADVDDEDDESTDDEDDE